MNEILDDFEKERKKNLSKTFSRIAFGCAMISLVIFVYFISSMSMISAEKPFNPTRDLILTNGVFFLFSRNGVFDF